MQLNDDLLTQWETIVSDVHKSDIPLECVQKMVFKLVGRRQKTINLQSLKKQGLAPQEIESIVTRMFNELDEELMDVDFVIDITSVANVIQPETDKLLGKI